MQRQNGRPGWRSVILIAWTDIVNQWLGQDFWSGATEQSGKHSEPRKFIASIDAKYFTFYFPRFNRQHWLLEVITFPIPQPELGGRLLHNLLWFFHCLWIKAKVKSCSVTMIKFLFLLSVDYCLCIRHVVRNIVSETSSQQHFCTILGGSEFIVWISWLNHQGSLITVEMHLLYIDVNC